jgi:hypothetical protein
VFLFYFLSLIFILLAEPLAPEVLKKLEIYESRNSHILERIEELSQAIARLAAENRSTREWFTSRLQLLWEKADQRDVAVADALKSILDHAKEMSAHVGLREFGEKLDALTFALNGPVDPALPIPSTLLPSSPTTSPADPGEPVSPVGVPKRPAEDDIESRKRRKIGEP